MPNIENIFCTTQQAIILHEKGALQDSFFYWFPNPNTEETRQQFRLPEYNIALGSKLLPNQIRTIREEVLSGNFSNTYSAYDVGTLGAMLLKETKDCYYHKPSGMWSHNQTNLDKTNLMDLFSTQAECYADRLIYLMSVHPITYNAEFINTRLQKFYKFKRMA